MSTFMAKAETIERRWFVIDAANKPLGKTAVAAANILRGKHRPEFTPHVDCGEFVIIINCGQGCPHRQETRSEVLSYVIPATSAVSRTHAYRTLMATKPELAMELAVKGMLTAQHPRRQSRSQDSRSTPAQNIKQQAQKPVAYPAE